jgi:putative peptidoglycan lipid II flippase
MAGLTAIAVHLLMGLLLMRLMGFSGLALATTLASVLNLWLLLRVLHSRLGRRGTGAVGRSAIRSLFCAAAMGVVIWMMAPAGSADAAMTVLRVGACVLTGLLVYTLLSYAVNRETLLRAVAVFRR